MKKILVLMFCVFFMGLVFVECRRSGTSALVGNWLLEEGQPVSADVEYYYSLSRDGIGIADIQKEISWKVENERFVITYAETSKTYEFDFKLQEKKLIISSDGNDHTYIKSSGNTDDLRKWRHSIETDPINLVGTWMLEDGQSFDGVIEDYKLLKDGTGITDIQNTMTWKVENGRFVITYDSPSRTHELDYKLQGKKLIISFGGEDHIYIKSSANSDDLRKWRSSIKIDPVNDEKRIFFRVVSTKGNSRMYIRQYGKNSPEMYIHWGENEIENISVNVVFRIDDGEAESSHWNRSTNKKATFYQRNVLQTVKKLLDAKQVVARCSSGHGEITAIFDITGFRDIVAKYNDDLNWF